MTTAGASITTNLGITVSDISTTVNCEPRVHDLTLARVLGLTNIYEIRRLIRRHLPTLERFGEVSVIRQKPSGVAVPAPKTGEVSCTRRKPGASGGRPGTDYWLNKRQALYITAKSDTERAALVTVQMVEVFDAVTSGRAIERPIRVRAHTRSRPKLPRPEALASGRGCIVLGEPIYFDTIRRPRVGDLALVMWRTGRISIEPMRHQHSDLPEAQVPGPAYVWVLKPGRQIGTLHCREKVTLLGTVTMADGRPMPSRLL